MDQEQIQKRLIDELGLAGLAEEKQQEIIIQMTEFLLKKIFLETMENLGEAGRNEYEKLIDSSASLEKIEEFLKAKIADYDAMVEKVIMNFRQEMIASIKK
jgi:hypothetical protein